VGALTAVTGLLAQETAQDPDWALLARSVGGDELAFARLVDRHQQRVLRTCERFLGNVAEAEEAAQEVFLKLFRRAGSLEVRGLLSTLLYRVAVNHCLNQLRRRKILRFVGFTVADEGGEARGVPEPMDGRPDALAELEARARWRVTRRAIAALPENQRAVLILARFEGLSYRQIAEVLEISLGAVESRLFRAMRNLEAALEKAGFRVAPGGGTT
jgi:RNA polymerase sigma-70 factor, ECF subfamily